MQTSCTVARLMHTLIWLTYVKRLEHSRNEKSNLSFSKSERQTLQYRL